MIIGIGGVSRAGKTTLANQLLKAAKKKGKSVEILNQDDFVKSKNQLPVIEGVPDWERPNSIKWDNVMLQIERSKADIIIVEGLFAFYPASLRVKYDKKLFIEIEKELFLKRKQEDKRWEEEPDWYPEHVWRSYLKYGKTKGEADDYVMLNGAKDIDIKKLMVLLEI